MEMSVVLTRRSDLRARKSNDNLEFKYQFSLEFHNNLNDKWRFSKIPGARSAPFLEQKSQHASSLWWDLISSQALPGQTTHPAMR